MDQCGSAEYTKNTKAKNTDIIDFFNDISIRLFHFFETENSSLRSVSTSQLTYY